MIIARQPDASKVKTGTQSRMQAASPAGTAVLLAGGDTLLREGLKRLLENSPLYVCCEVSDWQEVPTPSTRPVIILAVDPDLRPGSPPPWHNLVARIAGSTRVVALFTGGGDREVIAALRAGAAGCLFANLPATVLVQALHLVGLGGNLFPTSISSSFANTPATQDDRHLTPRERDILRGLVAGQSNKEIANGLGTTDMTVKAQLRHLLRKLGVSNRTQAALWAREQGFV
jgi:DNA-binding NarL/FixJ family response regulator